MRGVQVAALTLAVGAAAACVPQRKPAPPPEPAPKETPAPRPLPAPPPPAGDWRDVPLTPGSWYYSAQAGGSQALFGPRNSEAALIVRCDLARRQVTLLREGAASGPLTVRTTSGARSLPGTARSEPMPYLSASVAADDRFLDSIVFSRGRFTVETPGRPMLIVPSWAEPARVIEDCRA